MTGALLGPGTRGTLDPARTTKYGALARFVVRGRVATAGSLFVILFLALPGATAQLLDGVSADSDSLTVDPGRLPLPKAAEPVTAAAPKVEVPLPAGDAVDPLVSVVREEEAAEPRAHEAPEPVPFAIPLPQEPASWGLGGLAALTLAWAVGALEPAVRWVGRGPGPRWLRGIPFFSLFSRIDEGHLLDNPVRARVWEGIRENPGIPLTELAGRVGIAWGTLVHHVTRLERHGVVVSARGGAGRLLFPANTESSRLRSAWAAASHPTARRIAEYVRAHPGTDQQAMCVALGLRNPAASKHLTRFERVGLVASRAEARHRSYVATGTMDAVLQAAPVF